MDSKDNLIYVFDTNALYDYSEKDDENSLVYGLKFHNDFREKIKVIPSISLMELLVKKRNNPKYICEIFTMMVEENFYLSRSQFAFYNAQHLLDFVLLLDDFLRIVACNKTSIVGIIAINGKEKNNT